MTSLDCSMFTAKVEEKRALNLYRNRQHVEKQNARSIVIDGRKYLNFSSNDYLGLNHHVDINKAFAQGAEKFGTCSSASSLITGYQYPHKALEEKICEWLNMPNCLLFGSGFSANFGVLETLGQSDVGLCLDKLSHASLIDGAIASGTELKRFKHNDAKHLDIQLAKFKKETKFIVSEGIFSMDGDAANIDMLVESAIKYNAGLFIDDAHAIGVVGSKGQGSISKNAKIDIVMATFGKAIATSGAFVACNDAIHEYLTNFCRHYIYSTAISPAVAWATAKSIEIIKEENWRRDKVHYLSRLLTSSLDKNYQLISSDSSIHAIVLGDEKQALAVSQQLKDEYGIWLSAIRPPTVPSNTSRLRVTITASHNDRDIKRLVDCLHEVLYKCQT